MPKVAESATVAEHLGRRKSSVLDLDTLRYILSFIETHDDLISAMLTCHALYDAGIQPLVRLPITIYEHEIRPFYDFMLSHSPITFLAFREFNIDWVYEPPEDTSLIIELLTRGTKLRQLKLPHSVLYDNEGVGEAIINLKELEEFAIEGGYYNAIDHILTRLYYPLTQVDVLFEDEDEDDSLDPILLLANYQNTLERARIASAPLYSADVCYPKLLHLDIQLSGRPSLSILATVFPNLQNLFIKAGAGMEEADLTDLRYQNIAFQEGRKRWEFLTSVTANFLALYAMGLKNKLKSLTIPRIRMPTAAHIPLLRTAISTTDTEELFLRLPDIPTNLSEVFRDGLRNPLVSVKFTLEIHRGINHEKTLASTSLPALFSRN